MVEVTTKLSASSDINADLDRFADKIEKDVLLTASAAMARVVYDELKLNTSGARAPTMPGVKTRTLHNAVYRAYSPERSNDGRQVYHVSVNKAKAPHWHLLEYGTSRMRPRPYLRPAFDKVPEAIKAGQLRMKEKLGS